MLSSMVIAVALVVHAQNRREIQSEERRTNSRGQTEGILVLGLEKEVVIDADFGGHFSPDGGASELSRQIIFQEFEHSSLYRGVTIFFPHRVKSGDSLLGLFTNDQNLVVSVPAIQRVVNGHVLVLQGTVELPQKVINLHSPDLLVLDVLLVGFLSEHGLGSDTYYEFFLGGQTSEREKQLVSRVEVVEGSSQTTHLEILDLGVQLLHFVDVGLEFHQLRIVVGLALIREHHVFLHLGSVHQVKEED